MASRHNPQIKEFMSVYWPLAKRRRWRWWPAHAQAAPRPQRRAQAPYPLEVSSYPNPLTSKTVSMRRFLSSNPTRRSRALRTPTTLLRYVSIRTLFVWGLFVARCRVGSGAGAAICFAVSSCGRGPTVLPQSPLDGASGHSGLSSLHPPRQVTLARLSSFSIFLRNGPLISETP